LYFSYKILNAFAYVNEIQNTITSNVFHIHNVFQLLVFQLQHNTE